MPTLVVGWEDQVGGAIAQFGPHALMLACVADRLGVELASLRSLVECRPKKGNGNLRVWCRGVADEPRIMLAVFDADRLHDLLGLRGVTTLESRIAALRDHLPGVRTHAIVRNTETLVVRAAAALGKPPPPKHPLLRDKVCNELAWRADSAAKRSDLCGEVPGFDALVADVVALLSEPTTR